MFMLCWEKEEGDIKCIHDRLRDVFFNGFVFNEFHMLTTSKTFSQAARFNL